MCGIAGIFNLSGGPTSEKEIRLMCKKLTHRGPDGEGFYPNPIAGGKRPPAPVRLGHRRLKIVDQSEAGRQPMCNEDGTLWVTFNGEIYNFQSLREELKSLGHRFRSQTDTETILHAYEQWGVTCAARFNGMWALALWDQNRRSLWLSRDRFGIKPLYYLMDKKGFYFASEIKAILAVHPSERLPNYPYLATFLARGRMDYGEQTCFENIKSLPPANSLLVSSKGIVRQSYWALSSEMISRGNPPGDMPENGLPGKLFDLLKSAVKMRLFGDVALGSCLSGGLDSSSIVAMTTPHVKGLRTYSSVFPGYGCDETEYVSEVAHHFNIRPCWIRPQADNFLETISKIVYHQDEPGAAYGTFAQWMVIKRAAGEVRILLDGQGGDELLGGYHIFFPHYLKTLREDPDFGPPAATAAQREIEALFGPQGSAVKSVENNRERRYRAAILHPDIKTQTGLKPKTYQGPFGAHLDNVLFLAMTRDILPGLLHYQDRISMAFSIESRVPFLDYRLVEFCFGLPYQAKIQGSTTKAILRKAMANTLPAGVCGRRDKLGFPVPLAHWLRHELKQPVEDILLSDRLGQRGVIHPATLKKRLQAHMRGETDHTFEIWRWLTLEMWFHEFIDHGSG